MTSTRRVCRWASSALVALRPWLFAQGLIAGAVACAVPGAGPAVLDGSGPKGPELPAARPPHSPYVAPTAERAARAAEPRGFFKDAAHSTSTGQPTRLAPGVTLVRNADGKTRVLVEPAAVDVESLPIVDIPAPPSTREIPESLSYSAIPTRLLIEPLSQKGTANSVYVRVDAALGRVQLGNVGGEHHAPTLFVAGDRVYRACNFATPIAQAMTVARWSLLERDPRDKRGAKVVYRVIDGWFDARICAAAAVKQTVVHPTPLASGLLYAFRSRCDPKEDECIGERLIVLAPSLTNVGVASLGGTVHSSQGNFAVIELPLRRGGSASFTGDIHEGSLARWLGALNSADRNAALQQGSAVVGVEISHAVGEHAPTAIAYATIVSR